MDALKAAVLGGACSADGVAAASNPVASLVGSLAAAGGGPSQAGMMMAGIGRGPASGPAQFEMAARPRGPPPAGDLRAEFQRAAMAKQAEAQAIQAKLEAAHARQRHHAGGGSMAGAWQRSASSGGAGGGAGALHTSVPHHHHPHASQPMMMGGHRAGMFGHPHMMMMGARPPMMMGYGGGVMMGGPPGGGMQQAVAPPPAPQVVAQQAPAPPTVASTAQATTAPSAHTAAATAATSSWNAVGATATESAAPVTTTAPATTTAAAPVQAAQSGRDETRDWSKVLADSLRDDPAFQESEFVKFMSQMGDGQLAVDGNTVVQQDVAPAPQIPASSAQKFEQAWRDSMAGQEVDVSALFNSMVEEMSDPVDRAFWTDGAVDEGVEGPTMSATEKYELGDAAKNPYAKDTDAFNRGMQLFKEGKLHQAVQAFEAVVHQQSDHSDAWRMLGVCHAENDEDTKAILCLERAVEEDPYNLDALLALGVSYVNEMYYDKALAALKSWVEHNPKFHGLKVQDQGDAYGAPGDKIDDVMHLMLQATSWDNKDPEVQVVLGVLYNVSKDFDGAIGCFQAALNATPDDYSLWNKLGATRANSHRSEEAIPAYRRALELKPTYARGWLNLGISHANLGHYADAARAYIAALKLNGGASHIWGYLRIALMCLQREDLVALSRKEDVSLLSKFDI